MEGRQAIFLDRDGVINYERNDYVKSFSEFRFIEGALEGIGILSQLGPEILIITNQSVVGRSLISEAELIKIHEKMTREIEGNGGRIDGIFYCPHRPEEGCLCRKPNIGLFTKATTELRLSLKDSLFIGDKQTDAEAGRNAGCRTLIIKSNTQGSLLRAAKWIASADIMGSQSKKNFYDGIKFLQ